jgi:arabinofuranosyltransferase
MYRRFDFAWALAAAAGVVVLAIARAWTCDDAFITFRAVEQLVAGNGPVYNVGERVQVFTHPLWFFALAAWNALGGSLYPGSMFLSLVVFATGVAALVLAFRDRPIALAAVLVAMLCSRAAMDYATSGLETPASFALAMIAVLGLRSGRRVLAVAALALMPLNRPDLAVWVLPFAFAIPVAGWRGRLGVLALIAAPALAWAAFSTIYYGSPVPNTALAKLSGETWARLDQGLSYLTASLVTDPGTLTLLVAGVAVGIVRRRDPLPRAAFVALVLSLAYAVWAGGDFMLGRFVLPAIWAAIVSILAAPPSRRGFAALAALLVAAHAVYGDATLRTRVGSMPGPGYAGPNMNGVLDERRFYLPWLGLFPTRDLATWDFARQHATPTSPQIVFTLGVRGYLAPRQQATIDWFALADPMLARIRPFAGGRPGHAMRPIPESFWQWRDPAHSFGDRRLDTLAHALRLAHRSPELFSSERVLAVTHLLRERRVPIEAIAVHRDPEGVDIAIHAARIDLRFPREGMPVVWASRDCAPGATILGAGYLVPAGGDGIARLRCPAQGFDATPLAVSAGTLDPARAEPTFSPFGVEIVRERFVWLKDVPRWATSGWD